MFFLLFQEPPSGLQLNNTIWLDNMIKTIAFIMDKEYSNGRSALLFYYVNLYKELFIVEPKATCHITQQASINARTSVRYPI